MFWQTPKPPRSVYHQLLEYAPGAVQITDLVELSKIHLQSFRNTSNKYLSSYEPWQLVIFGIITAYILSIVHRFFTKTIRIWQDRGWKQVISGFIMDLPFLRGAILRQQQDVIAKLRSSLKKTKNGHLPNDALVVLPNEGISAAQIKQRLLRKAHDDVSFSEGSSRVSGAIYLSGGSHQLLLNEVYKIFSLTNPMHADIFPSVRKMEAEVVAMTASILGGGPAGDPGVCGAMTSGGTESILTAIKASRDYMMATQGITEPEMVIAESAHAAFVKAAEYFKIRAVKLPVSAKDFRLPARAVARAITSNTVVVVASAPGFPHGVMDQVQEIAAVCRRRGVLLHVDACLGGFMLPFARDLGYPVPSFDFSVAGVTSMSVDTHKFGQAHKGTSVVLYRSAALRRYQYTRVTDWTGGLYISPGFAGSRSGALIATAWAAMVHMGRSGYRAAASSVMESSRRFITGIKKDIPELDIVGEPDMCVIAFKSGRCDVDIYRVNDLMSARGWHLNALQRPAALHVCFTAAHSNAIVDELLRDLKECVAGLLEHPEEGKGEGSAPLYGMAAVVPDRRIVGNFLVAYQDILLEAE